MEQNSKIEKTSQLAETSKAGHDATSSVKAGSRAHEIDDLLVDILGDDYQDKTVHTESRDNYITGSKELDELVETILGKGWEESEGELDKRRVSDYTQKDLDELIESILGKGWEIDDEPLSAEPDSEAIPTEPVPETDDLRVNHDQPLDTGVSKAAKPQIRHVIDDQAPVIPLEPAKSRSMPGIFSVFAVLVIAIAIWMYFFSTDENTAVSVEQVSAVKDSQKDVKTTIEPSPIEEISVPTKQAPTTASVSEIGHFETAAEIATEPPVDEDMPAVTLPVEDDIESSITDAETIADDDMPTTTFTVEDDIESSVTDPETIPDDDMPTITFTVEDDNAADITGQQESASNKPPTREVIIYTIVSGDTFWSIADRFVKNPYRYIELAEQNSIPDPTLIYPGNKIRIIKISK
ncbi:MAG: LysM peptidoglycan-binding domain-containing protein [Gammaproteobacteria bacterium]|nr:LysM peptidoglycan-binding domain-containing protein [Gammaproteobacteria bacterium]